MVRSLLHPLSKPYSLPGYVACTPFTRSVKYTHTLNLPCTLDSFAGVGGNLVAVQASRISTALHSCGPPGTYKQSQVYRGPLRTFFSKGTHVHVYTAV